MCARVVPKMTVLLAAGRIFVVLRVQRRRLSRSSNQWTTMELLSTDGSFVLLWCRLDQTAVSFRRLWFAWPIHHHSNNIIIVSEKQRSQIALFWAVSNFSVEGSVLTSSLMYNFVNCPACVTQAADQIRRNIWSMRQPATLIP